MGNTTDREDRKILEISKRRQKLSSKHLKELNAFMVGLDGSGKSTILYKHLMSRTYAQDSIHIPPTITYNVETIKRAKATKGLQLCLNSGKPLDIPIAPVPAVKPIALHPAFRSPSSTTQRERAAPTQTAPLLLNIYDYGGKTETRTLWINYKDLKIKKLRKTGNRIDFFILVIDCTDLDRLDDEHDDSVQLALKPLLNMKEYLKIPLCIFANKQDLSNAIPPSVLCYRLGIKQVTVWNLIANVKYVHDLCISWNLSAEILAFVPNPNYYWNMSKRRWSMFGTETVSKHNKGIRDGIQWLYSEYDRRAHRQNKQRRHSLSQRFKITI